MQTISSIRAEERQKAKTKKNLGLLSTAQDWQLTVDIGRQLNFPLHVTKTSLRPDIILVSEATKIIVMLELTVPWKERMMDAFEWTREKYKGLVLGKQGTCLWRLGTEALQDSLSVGALYAGGEGGEGGPSMTVLRLRLQRKPLVAQD